MAEAWSEAQAQQVVVVSQGVQRSQFKEPLKGCCLC